MEEISTDVIKYPTRSLKSYYREAEKIMKKLRFGYLIYDMDNVSDCAESIMRAELEYDINKGQLSTFKFKCVQNECCHILRRKKSKKISYNYKTNRCFSVPFSIDYSLSIDTKYICEFVKDDSRLSESNKRCFQEYYILGHTLKDIAEILGITSEAVRQQLERVISLLKRRFQDV